MTYKRKVKKQVKKINIIYNSHKYMNDKDIKDIFIKSNKLEESIAMIKIMIERKKGLIAYDEQLICAIYLIDRQAVEMSTGEGKSLASLIACLHLGKSHKVYNVTVNEYLARRDYLDFKIVYDALDINLGLNLEYVAGKNIEEIYSKNVVYTSSSSLIFDYLNSVIHKEKFTLDFAILDEIDFILLDNANSYFSISLSTEETDEYNIMVIHKIDKVFKNMLGGEVAYKVNLLDYEYLEGLGLDYVYNRATRRCILTNKGEEKLLQELGVKDLTEDLLIYRGVVNALEVYSFIRRDIEYTVDDSKVKLINKNTGRLSEKTQMGEGIHAAIEVKENLEITEIGNNSIKSSYQVMFSKFNNLAGMSGTIMSDSSEFSLLYNLNTIKVPLHNKDRSSRLKTICFRTKEEKINEALNIVKERNSTGQPILVVCSNEHESKILSDKLKKDTIAHKVLNTTYTDIEDKIVKTAGEVGSITVSTSMAGRGTDITITEESDELGGLFVLSLTNYESLRIENQIKGRAGRQGFHGQFQQVSSLEDDIWSNINMNEIIKIRDKDDRHFYSRRNQNKMHKKMIRLQELVGIGNSSTRQHIYYTQHIIEDIKSYVFNYYSTIESTKEFIEKAVSRKIYDKEFIYDIEQTYKITILEVKKSEKIRQVERLITGKLKYTDAEYLQLINIIYDRMIAQNWPDLENQISGICLSVCDRGNFRTDGINKFIKLADQVVKDYLEYVSFDILDKIIQAKKRGENIE